MNEKLTRIFFIIIAVIVLFFAFSLNVLLGITAVLMQIGLFIYGKRDSRLVGKAMLENNKGNRELALQLLERAYKINPRNPHSVTHYAYLALKDGQIEKADQLLTKLNNIRNLTGKVKSNIGMTHALVRWKQGRIDEAISMLENIHTSVKTTILYGSLGYLYIEKGDLDKAFEFNSEAVDYNDTDAVIVDNLLLTCILRGDWELAEQTSEKLMNLLPKFPEAYYHDGLVKLHNLDYTGALEGFDTALSKPFSAVSTESREKIERQREETFKLIE